jgi:SAM-dependent methyltransferase
LALKVGVLPLKCIVCGNVFAYKIKNENLREDCNCIICKSSNRIRQLSYGLITSVLKKKPLLSSLKGFNQRNDLVVYNTEAKGPIHDSLCKMKNYVCSEYLGEEYKSGTVVNGILNQDLQNLSFADNSFDVVISSEVFEHIPDAYRAFREVYRVLKPGGRHVFTVPFESTGFEDSIRAIRDKNGHLQYLAKPEYHYDPLKPKDGILVYQIFSLEMMVKLSKIGFITNLHHLYNPLLGILGDNALVFESIKPN